MSKLDEPVTIHFKENSIPSLRRGVLTDESKDEIKDLMLELIEECTLKGAQITVNGRILRAKVKAL